MNKIKNIIVLTLCLMTTAVFGATTSDATSKGILGLFNQHEVQLNVLLDYQDVKQSKLNPGLGLAYYPSKYFGVRGSTVLNVDDVRVFNNAEVVGIVRLPLWVVSPYAGGGCKYSTLRKDEFSPIALLGVETRLAKQWGIFIEGSHDFANKNTDVGDFAVRLGLNLRIH